MTKKIVTIKILISKIIRSKYEEINMLNANQRFVITMLSDFMADKDTCWPSEKELARVCGMSVRTVIRILKFLEKENILLINRNHNKVNKYKFNPFWIEQFSEIGVRLSPRYDSVSPPEVSDCHTEDTIKNINKSKYNDFTNGKYEPAKSANEPSTLLKQHVKH